VTRQATQNQVTAHLEPLYLYRGALWLLSPLLPYCPHHPHGSSCWVWMCLVEGQMVWQKMSALLDWFKSVLLCSNGPECFTCWLGGLGALHYLLLLLLLLDHDADAPAKKRMSSGDLSLLWLISKCVSRILWPPSPHTLAWSILNWPLVSHTGQLSILWQSICSWTTGGPFKNMQVLTIFKFTLKPHMRMFPLVSNR
jgi:hypothetical protein